MNFTFEIKKNNINEFIDDWSLQYSYQNENLYSEHIGKEFTDEARKKLFMWKNGMPLSKTKEDIVKSYPLKFDRTEDLEKIYLDDRKRRPIWNIFYLHCVDQKKWPIFDQHTYRAMKFIKTGKICELNNEKNKCDVYKKEYKPFIEELLRQSKYKKEDVNSFRKLDKALFAFGQFLKIANNYMKI